MIEIGKSYTIEQVVTPEMTARAIGSGGLEVFGTPFMMAMMEHAAMDCVQPDLPEGKGTVGVDIQSSHLAPEGAVTMPMRANGSPAAASDRQHTGSVSPSTRQSTTSGHAWRSCAQSERRKSSFIGAFRLLPPQTAVSNCRVGCISVSAFLSCPASRPRESPWRCRGRSRAAHSKTRSGRCAPRCRG